MAEDIVRSVLKRNERAAARLMTLIEEGRSGLKPILRRLQSQAKPSYRIGITGPPGAGKSTLIDRLVEEFRKQNKSVGVVAVDVSSPVTSGAILGDRIRMKRHFQDPGVFIRSMANRGHLGGLARRTAQVLTVLEALGKEIIFLETVGVGQAEVEVAGIADTVVVVTTPGQGDDIQAMKAGLLEVGHLFIVNKADQAGADQTARYLQEALTLNHKRTGWQPRVCKTIATQGNGIENLLDALTAHAAFLKKLNPRLKI